MPARSDRSVKGRSSSVPGLLIMTHTASPSSFPPALSFPLSSSNLNIDSAPPQAKMSTFHVNTALVLVQCQPYAISWAGGTAPYFLSITKGGDITSIIENAGKIDGDSYTWVVDRPVGTSVTFVVTDSKGRTAMSAASGEINKGSDDSCLKDGKVDDADAPPAPKNSTSPKKEDDDKPSVKPQEDDKDAKVNSKDDGKNTKKDGDDDGDAPSNTLPLTTDSDDDDDGVNKKPEVSPNNVTHPPAPSPPSDAAAPTAGMNWRAQLALAGLIGMIGAFTAL
ncbi:hypothetical protein V8E36_004499 [Tilletia maclaganii]